MSRYKSASRVPVLSTPPDIPRATLLIRRIRPPEYEDDQRPEEAVEVDSLRDPRDSLLTSSIFEFLRQQIRFRCQIKKISTEEDRNDYWVLL